MSSSPNPPTLLHIPLPWLLRSGLDLPPSSHHPECSGLASQAMKGADLALAQHQPSPQHRGLHGLPTPHTQSFLLCSLYRSPFYQRQDKL